MPGRGGCDGLSLGQGKSVHVSKIPGSPQGLWDSSLGGAHGGVTGWVRGRSHSMPRSRMKESTEWCTPRKTRRSRILPHDRAEIQSCPPSLSPGISHPERSRTRAPELNEGSLKHKTSTVRKTPSSPIAVKKRPKGECFVDVRTGKVAVNEGDIARACSWGRITGKIFREREPRRREQVQYLLQHWRQARSLISASLDIESLVKPL